MPDIDRSQERKLKPGDKVRDSLGYLYVVLDTREGYALSVQSERYKTIYNYKPGEVYYLTYVDKWTYGGN